MQCIWFSIHWCMFLHKGHRFCLLLKEDPNSCIEVRFLLIDPSHASEPALHLFLPQAEAA